MSSIDGIIGFAIGDALGVPYEFIRREKMDKKPCNDMIGGGTHGQVVGTWSDDTSLTMATMDAMKQAGEVDYDVMMENFCLWDSAIAFTAHGEVFDEGYATRSAIDKYRNKLYFNRDGYVDPTTCGGTGIYDNGNGSMMRILPIAYYFKDKECTDEEIAEVVGKVSSLTHAHPISKMGCYLYTKFALGLLNGKSFADSYDDLTKCDVSMFGSDTKKIYERVLSGKIGIENDREMIRSSGYVVDSLEACLWCCLNSRNFEDAVLKAVNLGEDTDTIGGLTGGLAGIKYGIESVPSKWIDKLVKKDELYNLCNEFDLALKNNKTKSKTGLI